jgi:CTP-dependent riboflavin kinase
MEEAAFTGFTCIRHELFTEAIKELSPMALVALVKMLTYQPGFVIRQNYLATQLGIKESRHMKARMDELIGKGYLTKSGEGQFTFWQLTDKALAFKKWGGHGYYRLLNDSVENLKRELCDGEVALYLHMLTNALTHKMTNAELVERTGYPKQTISRYVNHLEEIGYLHKEEVGYNKVLWSMTKLRREGFIMCGDNDIYDLYSTYETGIQ